MNHSLQIKRIGFCLPLLVLMMIMDRPVFGYHITLQFDNLTIEDGLSQNTINAIMQDRQGFIWLATQDGLNRYNGYNFICYKNDPQNINTLSGNYIYLLVQDPAGGMWIGTRGHGLDRFDPELETFTHYRNNPNDPGSLADDFVKAILIDRQGRIWVGTENSGLDCFIPTKRFFKHHIHDATNQKSLSDNNVTTICQDSIGTIWVGTESGLNRLDAQHNTFDRYYHDPDLDTSLPDNAINTIYEDRQTRLWVGTKNGLVQLDGQGQVVKNYQYDPANPNSLSNNQVNTVYEDRQGRLWVGTNNGVNLFNPEMDAFEVIQEGLSNSNIGAIYEDHSGNLWFGTYTAGLYKFSKKKFLHYKQQKLSTIGSTENSIWAICEDQSGRLWLGTENDGVCCFDRSLQQTICYRHDPNDPGSLSHNKVQVVFKDSRGFMWVGTENGLNRFVPDQKTFIRYFPDPDNSNSLSDKDIMSISEDHLGMLWIATYKGGLNQFDVVHGTFRHYTHHPDQTGCISYNRVYCVSEDHLGFLWVGTSKGLNRFDRNSQTFKHFIHDPANPQSLPDNRIYSILESRANDCLWITTKNGLNRLDLSTQTFTRFSEKDGLPNNTVYAALEDNNGNLWLSTNRGLSQFNIKTGRFRNFTREDGLQSNEFNMGAYYQNRSNEIFFGGINGFNVFVPEKVVDHPYPPNVVLTSFKVFDKEVLSTNDLLHTPMIHLSYRDNFFAFEFAGLDFLAPEKNQYAYQLVGFDQDWIFCGQRRYASYTNLDGGKYVFKVKASNADGVWNEQGLSIDLVLQAPPWKTWWALTGYVLLVSGILAAYLRFNNKQHQKEIQVQQLKHETEMLKEKNRIQEEVERISRHDLKTPLNSIIALPQVLLQDRTFSEEQRGLIKTIEKSGYLMLNMVDLSLNLFKMENRTYRLQPIKINITRIIKSILADLKNTAASKGVRFDLRIENRSTAQAFGIMGEELLCYSMLANLLKNAVEASPQDCKVTIHLFREQTGQANIQINNQGVVPEKIRNRFFEKYTAFGKKSGIGLGTYSARLMAEIMGGQISMKTDELEGTTIEVRLPSATLSSLDLQFDQDLVNSDTCDIPLLPSLKVLVADDDEYNGLVFKNFLKHPQILLELALNGKLAVEKHMTMSFDIILMDLEMPVMGGMEAVSQIRQWEEACKDRKKTVIIALSAHDDQKTCQECLASGFDDYLQKPVNRNLLQQRVSDFAAAIKSPTDIAPKQIDSAAVNIGEDTMVQGDPALKSLIPGFLRKKQVEMDQMAVSFKARDLESLRKLSHKLKGAYSMYGFKQLASACGTIETMAKTGAVDGIQSYLDILNHEYKKVWSYYKDKEQ